MSKKEIEETLEQLYIQSKIRFGSAIKSRWLHDGDCPGCGREITPTKYKGKDSLSPNAFIYREKGVLIAYLLCGKCAGHIIKRAETDPYSTTPLHTEIEKTLKQAYLRHLGH